MKKSTECKGSGQAMHDIHENSWNSCPNRDERCIETFSVEELILKDGQYFAPSHKLQVQQRDSSPAPKKRIKRSRASRARRSGR
jgi:hypothetical protein